MKKWFSLFALMLLICGCSEKAGFLGKNYQLQNAQNGVKVTLAFAAEEPRYYGAVVNRYFGTYELNGSKIKFSPAGVTMMMGPEKSMEAEQNFLGILPHITSYKMVENNLVLITDNGQELGFKEIPADTQD